MASKGLRSSSRKVSVSRQVGPHFVLDNCGCVSPCFIYRVPRLCTVSSVDVWSGPQAFSNPANARRYIASASCLDLNTRFLRHSGVYWICHLLPAFHSGVQQNRCSTRLQVSPLSKFPDIGKKAGLNLPIYRLKTSSFALILLFWNMRPFHKYK